MKKDITNVGITFYANYIAAFLHTKNEHAQFQTIYFIFEYGLECQHN